MSKKEKKAIEEDEVKAQEGTESSEEVSQEKTSEHSETVDESPEALLALEKDKFLRLFAEFENYKKRTTKERIDLFKTAGREVIAALLPVVDDFERAISNNEDSEDVVAIKEGFSLIYNKYTGILKTKGLKPMEAKGEVFDPEVHEAVANMPTEDKKLKGKIIDDVEKGYLLNDKVLRYAKVVVGQ